MVCEFTTDTIQRQDLDSRKINIEDYSRLSIKDCEEWEFGQIEQP